MPDPKQEKATEIPKISIQSMTVEQQLERIRENLKYVFYPISKEETKLFKPVLQKLQAEKIVSESEAKKLLAEANKPPLNLLTRSSAIRELLMASIVNKLDKNASKEFKKQLIQNLEAAVSITDGSMEEVKMTMKKYGLDKGLRAISGNSKMVGDPLFMSPIGIPLDKKFYEGLNDKAVLPVGEKYSKHIPEFFWNEIKDGDPVKMFIFQMFSHYYRFTVNFYNDIKNDKLKILMYYGFVKPMQLAMQGALKVCSSSNLEKVSNVGEFLGKYLGKTFKAIGELMSDADSLLKKTGADFAIKHTFHELTKSMQGLARDIKAVTNYLTIAKGVLKIAKRNPTKIREHRIKHRADTFLQNKLFLLVLLEHKGAHRIDKYYIELIARVIANFKNDQDLRTHFGLLKPNIVNIFLTSKYAKDFLKSVNERLYRQFIYEKDPKKKRKIIETALDLLLPVQVLDQKQEQSPENKKLVALHKLFTHSFASATEGTPYNKNRTQQLLAINLLLDNVRVYLVKKDLVKADKIAGLLVDAIKAFNVMLTPKEKAKITKDYPELADFLNNPNAIKKLIDTLVNPNKADQESKTLATKIKDLLGVKRKKERDEHIKKIQKFVAELKIVKSKLSKNPHYKKVTGTLSRLRKKYDKLEKEYYELDKQLKKLYVEYGDVRKKYEDLKNKFKLAKTEKERDDIKKASVALITSGKKFEKQIGVVSAKISSLGKQLPPLNKAIRVASAAFQKASAPIRKVQSKIAFASQELNHVHKELQQMKSLQALMEATGTKDAVDKLLKYTKKLLFKDIPKEVKDKAKVGVLKEVYADKVSPILSKANKVCDYIIQKSNLATVFGKQAPAKSLLFKLLVLNRVKDEKPNVEKLKTIIFESVIASLKTTKFIAYLEKSDIASLSEVQRKKNVQRLKFHIAKAINSIT